MLCMVIILPLISLSQEETAIEDDTKAGRLSPKEFTIPPSPVFDLMGVTSSQINRTSDIKDFKVDWSFKSWKLNPNLAIQSQPVWELLYNRKNLEKYQAASRFMRRFSSLDISIGSVQDENNDRRIGFAAKVNLYKQRDPLMARELYAGISEKYDEERKQLNTQLLELNLALDSTKDIIAKPGIRSQIKATEEQLATIHSRRNDEINGRAKIFVAENWNASSLDIAFGRVYSYRTDSAGTLKTLRLNRNTAWGAWMNGNIGLGKKFLLSGLVRTSWYEEELNFQMVNIATGEEITQAVVADNTLFTTGLNLRYGGSIYTFFIEFLYERKGLKTPMQALNDVFNAPKDFEVVGSTVKWDVVHPNTLTIGGDWRISQAVILNYGMRAIFNNNWKFTSFIPVATVSCMMR